MGAARFKLSKKFNLVTFSKNNLINVSKYLSDKKKVLEIRRERKFIILFLSFFCNNLPGSHYFSTLFSFNGATT